MFILEVVALCAIGFVVVLFGFALRRYLLIRISGSIDLHVRILDGSHRHWMAGIGRYSGDNLVWYRIFSFSHRPTQLLSRRDVEVIRRRPPKPSETWAVQHDAVVIECQSQGQYILIVISEQALNGFLSWLQSIPPGYRVPGFIAS